VSEFVRYVILGIVQGLTELLPISSSGHLVLVGHGLGIQSPGLLVEVVLHVATLLAVVMAFRRDVLDMLKGVIGRSPEGLALVGRLIVATLPVVVLAPLLKDQVESAFDSPRFAATMLLVTGVMLLSTRLVRRPGGPVRRWDALVMGVAQVLALLPGISRSGTTISAGFWRGVERREAARFSFLMSIPAIAGAAVFEFADLDGAALADISPAALAAGFVASFAAGLLAIHLLFKLVGRNRFEWFGIYCLVAGALSLWLLARGA
jgi:undecaprenyl-diphosphatase